MVHLLPPHSDTILLVNFDFTSCCCRFGGCLMPFIIFVLYKAYLIFGMLFVRL